MSRLPPELLLTRSHTGVIYVSMRRSGRWKDASARDSLEMDGEPKSSGRTRLWLPESGFEKAPMLQMFGGGESALRNSVARKLPGKRKTGD